MREDWNKRCDFSGMITQRNTYASGNLLTTVRKGNLYNEEEKGLIELPDNNNKRGLIYVPYNYTPEEKAALVLMLHGAGGNAEQALSYLKPYAERENLIIVAPASKKYSWDIITDQAFGNDVIYIDSVLDYVSENYAIDPGRVAIGGFSDGASYALSLGLTNGHLFSHIIAFSPGFVYSQEIKGQPRLFISHGCKDDVLPIHRCSRRIIEQLNPRVFKIEYSIFPGKHEIPKHISEKAVSWLRKQ